MSLFLVFSLGAQVNYEIRTIKFKGNKAFQKDELASTMAISEVRWVQKVVFKKVPYLYHPEMVKMEEDRLTAFYQSEGFLNTSVRLLSPVVNDKRRTVKLVFEIEEGTPVSVNDVTVNVELPNQVRADSAELKLKRMLKVKSKIRFRDANLNLDLVNLSDYFRSLGHAYAQASFELGFVNNQHGVNVAYKVVPGPECTFGETVFKGTVFVNERFLQKQLVYNPGDVYSKKKLDQVRQYLYDLQMFKIVSVSSKTDVQQQERPIPVEVLLREAPRVSSKFGLGYGTEERFRAFVDITALAVGGGARRLNFYARYSGLEPYHVSVKWTDPQFLTRKTSLSINPFVKRILEPGYDTRTLGLNLPFSVKINRYFNASLTGYYEDVEQRVEAGDYELPSIESRDFPYQKSGLMAALAFDGSEPRFTPKKGFIGLVGFKYNGYFFNSDFNYTRLWMEARQYVKFKSVVFAFRAMGGGINSGDDHGFVPVEDRFYSGGSTSNRGWQRAALGPLRESGTPMGGKSILEMNAEARFPLFWRLDGALFWDQGNVWPQAYTYRFNRLAYSAGAGLRVNTPIGPIRFDVGIPLWSEKRSPQFFLNVGQAF